MKLIWLYFFAGLCFLWQPVFSQIPKKAYIPYFLQDSTDPAGKQFSVTKTFEDSNFTIIWGNTVGTDPKNYSDPDLSFDPAEVCRIMEEVYTNYKNFGFLNDSLYTNVAKYKFPIIMYNTWEDTLQGEVKGSSADNFMGALWIRPNVIRDAWVPMREFAKCLQAQNNFDFRSRYKLGPSWVFDTLINETHASFMRALVFPWAVTARGMDNNHIEEWGDWKNASESYPIFMALMADDSNRVSFINRLWRECKSTEMPMATMMRLSGLTQSAFNDKMFRYVRRMPTFDFPYVAPNQDRDLGSYFRQYRNDDLLYNFASIQSTYDILSKVPGSTNRYYTKMEIAPEEYAYNVIPLYPTSDTCSVIVKFAGYTETNKYTGWRYGFVAEDSNGIVSRYSEIYKDDTKAISFKLDSNEKKMYLVVMGAPESVTIGLGRQTWDGYPKKFRFPYELKIKNALPEGYQPASEFRKQVKINGHIHPNGGGWVSDDSFIEPTAYIDSSAVVIGAYVGANARVEKTALVKNCGVRDNTVVTDNAFVIYGDYFNDALISGKAYSEANVMLGSSMIDMRATVKHYKLTGSIEVGGDVVVDTTAECGKGVYYAFTNYKTNFSLPCDSRTASSYVNLDVNKTDFSFLSEDVMNVGCDCVLADSCVNIVEKGHPPVANAGNDIIIKLPINYTTLTGSATDVDNNLQAYLWNQVSGPSQVQVLNPNLRNCRVENLQEGVYTFSFTSTDAVGNTATDTIQVTVLKADGSGDSTAGKITTAYLFPIPANDEVTIRYPATTGGTASVYDVRGAKLMTVTIPPSISSSIKLPVKNLAPGVYFVRIDTKEKTKFKLRMVIVR